MRSLDYARDDTGEILDCARDDTGKKQEEFFLLFLNNLYVWVLTKWKGWEYNDHAIDCMKERSG